MENELAQLLNPKSRLIIEEDDYLERPDISKKAIYILGNCEGFINLCHIILYLANEAEAVIDLNKFDFVHNIIAKPVRVRSTFSEDDIWGENGFVKVGDSDITWSFGETNASAIAARVHGLCYSWNHLHFDAKEKSHHSLFMAIE